MSPMSTSTARPDRPAGQGSGVQRHCDAVPRPVRKAAGGANIGLVVIVLVAASAQPAAAQQTITKSCRFSGRRGRSHRTFRRDEQAADATREPSGCCSRSSQRCHSSSRGRFLRTVGPAMGTVMR